MKYHEDVHDDRGKSKYQNVVHVGFSHIHRSLPYTRIRKAPDYLQRVGGHRVLWSSLEVISWRTYPVSYRFPIGKIGNAKNVFGCEPRQ